MEGKPALESWDCVCGAFSHCDAKGNLTGKLLSNVSFEMADHAFFSSFPARLYILEDRLSHVSRTHRIDLDWLPELINLDSSITIRCTDHRTVTKGAFTTIQWESLMQLHDIHPPFNLYVRRSLVLQSVRAAHATSDVCNAQRGFEKSFWNEKLEDSSAGV